MRSTQCSDCAEAVKVHRGDRWDERRPREKPLPTEGFFNENRTNRGLRIRSHLCLWGLHHVWWPPSSRSGVHFGAASDRLRPGGMGRGRDSRKHVSAGVRRRRKGCHRENEPASCRVGSDESLRNPLRDGLSSARSSIREESNRHSMLGPDRPKRRPSGVRASRRHGELRLRALRGDSARRSG